MKSISSITRNLLIVLLFLDGGKMAKAEKELIAVSDETNLTKYILSDCAAEILPGENRAFLQLRFGHTQAWPHIRFLPGALGYPTDWSGFAAVGITVLNPGTESVKVNVRVDSEATERVGRQGGVRIPAGKAARMILPISDRNRVIGMRGQPPAWSPLQGNFEVIAHNGNPVDVNKITYFQIFLARPDSGHTVVVKEVNLLDFANDDIFPFVDKFGQYSRSDWPGKIHTAGEFAERIESEEKFLQDNPPIADRDIYGGWKTGAQFEKKGHFRVEKYRNKWWLVDPEGRLFWSSGITCVKFNAATVTAKREKCYEWLPADNDPLGQFYSAEKKRYDFFQANLFRKYGPGFEKKFFEMTARRFAAWGINTIGNWSAPESWRLKKIPYTIPVHFWSPGFVAHSHTKAGLEKKKYFPDPFDPQFKSNLEKKLQDLSEFKDDPWLIGVFIGNELPWVLGPTRLSARCLEYEKELELKRHLIDILEHKYGTVKKLNQSWGIKVQGWQQLSEGIALTPEQMQNGEDDLRQLDRVIAERYFKICHEAMRKHLPGILYLGCRFSGRYNREIVSVAAEYCDVVSFNVYNELPGDRTADELAMEMDFPVIIGEFHFGALDRGMFDPGLRRAKNQTERAEKYAAYIRAAAAAPWCVGAHWFQYIDQALTGRPDGENYNIGFLDATDDPYPEMREAAREIHSTLYRIRMQKN